MNLDYIDLVYQYLKKNKPDNLLMPCTMFKNPLYKHKNNAWNWNKVIENQQDFGPDKYQAILVRDLVIIDIDSKPLIEKYEDKFEILKTCPNNQRCTLLF